MNRLGLIAGNGRFPFLLLDAARAHGTEVVVASVAASWAEKDYQRLTGRGRTAGGRYSTGRSTGNALLFANNPVYRGEPVGSYPLVLNAILNFDHLAPPTASNSSGQKTPASAE